MKTLPLALLLAAVLLAPLSPQAPALAASEPADLVFNGGFEADSERDGIPEGWTPYDWPALGRDNVVRATPILPHGGERALEVLHGTPFWWTAGVRSASIPVIPGETLRISAWFQTIATPLVAVPAPQPGWPILGLEFVRPDSFFPDVSLDTPDAKAWTLLEYDVLVPWNVTQVRVHIDTQGTTVLRVDDVSLVRVPGDGNLLPNPSFETGDYWGHADLWWVPCSESERTWTNSGTHGRHALSLDVGANPHCTAAISDSFVLGPGLYRLQGDALVRGGDAKVWVLTRGADGGAWHEPEDRGLVWTIPPAIRWQAPSTTFCAPEGTAQGMVILAPPAGALVVWDNLRLERLGDCPEA